MSDLVEVAKALDMVDAACKSALVRLHESHRAKLRKFCAWATPRCDDESCGEIECVVAREASAKLRELGLWVDP